MQPTGRIRHHGPLPLILCPFPLPRSYADIAAQQGESDMARDLHERALSLDEGGMATMANR